MANNFSLAQLAGGFSPRQIANDRRQQEQQNALLRVLQEQQVSQNKEALRGQQLQNTQRAREMADYGKQKPMDPYKQAQIENLKQQMELRKQQAGAPKPMSDLQEKMSYEIGVNFHDMTPEQRKQAYDSVVSRGKAPTEADKINLDLKRAQLENINSERAAGEQSRKDSAAILEDAYRITDSLLSEDRRNDVNAAVGTVDSMLPTFSPSVKDVENEVETLKKMLAKDNLGLLSGVMSDSDIKFITDIATGELQLDGSQEKFVTTLEKIKSKLGAKLGKGDDLFNQADSIING